MFAYCMNNPSNYHDPSGNFCLLSCNGEVDLFTRGVTDFSFGGNLSSNGGGGTGVNYRKKFRDFITNISEEATFSYLDIYGIALYKGALIIRADLGQGSAFSLGIIVMDDYYSANQEGIDTLKHERGHLSHLRQIGLPRYLLKVAVPSAIGAYLSNKNMLSVDYESLPWERIADFYGGVDRGDYESWADYQAFLYWLLS